MASGDGSTFEAVHYAIETGELKDTEIAFVICNNGPNNLSAGIWERARRLDIDIFHVSNLTERTCTVPVVGGQPVKGTVSYEASERMAELSEQYDIRMLVALGFMRKIIGKVIKEFPIANAHHGPLPETTGKYGKGIDEAVMEQGLDFSGPTFHWMDKRIDENGLPIYDLDQSNLALIIGHERVLVTKAMRREWRDHKTATLLQAENVRVEKLWVPKWINLALGQLDAAR